MSSTETLPLSLDPVERKVAIIKDIVSNIKMGNYFGRKIYLQVRQTVYNQYEVHVIAGATVDSVIDGKPVLVTCGKSVPLHATESLVLQIVYALIRELIIHELDENFNYKGERIFDPHVRYEPKMGA